MSGSLNPNLRSPRQASLAYGAGRPRQRNLFLVRFRPGADVTGTALDAMTGMTYIIKHCDRPKIIPKTEELNQYNKKRVIYTGFKYEPLRLTFYDSADGAAQDMWSAYAQYYFSDFAQSSNIGYGYDVTTPTLISNNAFGLDQPYGGATDPASQWFFDHIEIYHFYTIGNVHKYDSYFLQNPRISSFEPDELDYESSVVSQINMTIMYENLQYMQAQPFSGGSFEEFSDSGAFWGDPISENAIASATSQVGGSANGVSAINPDVGSLLASVSSTLPADSSYRNLDSLTTGALSQFGNFSFGGYSPASIASQAINGSLMNNISSTVGAATTQFGNAANNIASSLLTTGTGLVNNAAGTVLPPAAMAALNSNSIGTAQYGFNNGSIAGINPATYAQSLQNSVSNTVDSVSQWM